MNPSYNSSVGGPNSGGANPPGGVDGHVGSEQPAGAQPSAGVQQPMPSVSSVSSAPKPIMPQQSPLSQQPIASGAGDVMLARAPEKKAKKWPMIAAVVAILLVVLGVGGYLIYTNIGGGGGIGQASDLKTAFNSYVNYVMFGEESDADVNIDDVMGSAYYKNLDGSQIETYLENAKTRYDKLTEIYDRKYANNEDIPMFDFEVLETYFYDIPRLKALTEEDILKMYSESGETDANNEITKYYNTEEIINGHTIAYMEAEKALAQVDLRVLVATDKAGCIQNGALMQGCYEMSETESNEFWDSYDEVLYLDSIFYDQSIETIDSLYNLIYGVDAAMEENV